MVLSRKCYFVDKQILTVQQRPAEFLLQVPDIRLRKSQFRHLRHLFSLSIKYENNFPVLAGTITENNVLEE